MGCDGGGYCHHWSSTEGSMPGLGHALAQKASATHQLLSSPRHMATSGLDHQLKIFDLRATFQPLSARTLPQGAGHLAFSQRGLLAAGLGDVVNVWAGPGGAGAPCLERPYLTHRLTGHVHGLQFCPFEDVLGVGHSGGVTSMLVPGKWQGRACRGVKAGQNRSWSVMASPSLLPSRGC